jgi:hypothetical protein
MAFLTETSQAPVAGAEVAEKIKLDFKGGDKMKRLLKKMNTGLGSAKSVTVGFYDGARYSGSHGIRGTKRAPVLVAQVAFWNEFGTKHAPPRPFFRTMIENNSGDWGASLAYLAKVYNYDGRKMLGGMGMGIKAQLQDSIKKWSDPPNSPRTVAVKGFNNPLIDEGIMLRNVGYNVDTGIS